MPLGRRSHREGERLGPGHGMEIARIDRRRGLEGQRDERNVLHPQKPRELPVHEPPRGRDRGTLPVEGSARAPRSRSGWWAGTRSVSPGRPWASVLAAMATISACARVVFSAARTATAPLRATSLSPGRISSAGRIPARVRTGVPLARDRRCRSPSPVGEMSLIFGPFLRFARPRDESPKMVHFCGGEEKHCGEHRAAPLREPRFSSRIGPGPLLEGRGFSGRAHARPRRRVWRNW